MSKVTSMILRLFLPDVSAGACIVEHGCCCKAGTTKRALNCLGACVTSSSCRTGRDCTFL